MQKLINLLVVVWLITHLLPFVLGAVLGFLSIFVTEWAKFLGL